MIAVVRAWMQRYLSDPQAILLIVLLGGSVLLFMWMGKIFSACDSQCGHCLFITVGGDFTGFMAGTATSSVWLWCIVHF